MTYVFVNNDHGVYVVAWSNDLYQLIPDLDLAPGRYTVYETDLMPDEICKIDRLIMQGKLKYVTLLTNYVGAE